MKTRIIPPSRLLAALLVGSMAVGSSLSAAVIDLSKPIAGSNLGSDLVLNWTFNETSGTTATNTGSGGSAYNGTLTTSAAFPVPTFSSGHFGNAVNLLGGVKSNAGTDANPHVSWIASDTSQTALDGVASDFTAGLWVKFNETLTGESQKVHLIGRGRQHSSADSWGLELNQFQTGGDWRWRLDFLIDGVKVADTGNWGLVSAGFNPLAYNHIAFSFDYNEVGNNQLMIYLNGEQVGSTTAISQNISTISSPSIDRKLQLGERGVGNFSTVFNGQMDDFFFANGVHNFAIPEPALFGVVLAAFAGIMVIRRKKNTHGMSHA